MKRRDRGQADLVAISEWSKDEVRLTEHIRQQATVDDLAMLVALLKQARQCMGLKH